MARIFVAIALLSSAAPARAAAQSAPAQPAPAHSWKRYAAGIVTSILAHEAGHVAASLLQGAHPTFGLNRGRPTIYSGIDPITNPGQQFIFSSAGLNVQAALDEGILDSPHNRGGSFERGVLAGGIATTAFYLTIGRTARVSDVAYMVRTSGLRPTGVALIYGGVALLHIVRIELSGHYADFFVQPDVNTSALRVGVNWR